MKRFPIIKSLLAPDALAQHLEHEYGLANIRCQLITATVRDVYLVVTPQHRFIFYVYRHNHRPFEQIAAEWQFVAYLDMRGVPVAPALLTNSRDLILTFHAPEGIRYGVLTPFVAGQHLRQRPSVHAVRTYGRHIATIHRLADGMSTPINRPVNDALTIITQSVEAAQGALLDRPAVVAYLQACRAQLHPQLTALRKESPMYGMIHGDATRANAQVGDDGTLTVLDFDFCGPGWRAYDIASYLITIRGTPDEVSFSEAFLNGYTDVRGLTAAECQTLPLFEAVRAIFEIGGPAMYMDTWGTAYVYAFLDQSLAQLKRSMSRLA